MKSKDFPLLFPGRLVILVSGIVLLLTTCAGPLQLPVKEEIIHLSENRFRMLLLPSIDIPGGPTGRVLLEEHRADILTPEGPFLLAETNTTWDLWREVYLWGMDNGYVFNRPGQPGTEDSGEGMNGRHPVTTVDWPSVMVWCNALTEYHNDLLGGSLLPVYRYGETVARDASDRQGSDTVTCLETADGFRLPTGPEWELAARYSPVKRKGYVEYPLFSRRYWKPWLTVSGELENRVGLPGGDRGRIRSVEVDQTARNDLGFYGMEGREGKLWQWCFEYLGHDSRDTFRLKMGGSRGPRCSRHDNWPKTKWSPTCGAYNQITFRVARSMIRSAIPGSTDHGAVFGFADNCGSNNPAASCSDGGSAIPDSTDHGAVFGFADNCGSNNHAASCSDGGSAIPSSTDHGAVFACAITAGVTTPLHPAAMGVPPSLAPRIMGSFRLCR